MERNVQAVEFLRRDIEPIIALTGDHVQTIEWMRNNGLLLPNIRCCQMDCIQRNDKTRLDGCEFRCANPDCRRRYSIRSHTLWNNFRRVPLCVLVRLVFHDFVHQISAARATRRLVRAGINISSRTVRRIFSEIRRIVLRFMQHQVFTGLLRGQIEMDEALFTHRAGPGPRGARQVWAIGMVERRTGIAFVFVVANRTHAVINNLIRRYTLRGSMIIHDGWQGYSRIPPPWRHIDVSQDETTTTSQVEGLWGQLRSRIRNMYSGGVVEGNIEEVLTEVLWRRNVDFSGRETLQELINIIANA